MLTLILSYSDSQSIETTQSVNLTDEKNQSLCNVIASEHENRSSILDELAAIRQDIQTVKLVSTIPTAENIPAVATAELGELTGALSEAMKQISSRDNQIDLLTKNVNQANIQRNLVRLTQSLEIARTLQTRVGSSKSDPKESFDFLVDDLDSALSDQGVEAMEITVGTKVSDLAAGSFAAISVVDAPEDALRGTVKEVRSRCYFIPEAGKKSRFIAPAKVILYRA